MFFLSTKNILKSLTLPIIFKILWSISKVLDRILKYHPNHGEINTQVGAKGVIENKNDQLGGYCHLSNRGNLLLAIEVNQLLFN